MANGSTKTIILSDGRTATLRRPIANDLINAQEAAPGNNRFKYICALLSQIVTIDGKAQVYEDIKQLWANDVDRLSSEANGIDFLSSSESTSQPLSKEDSHSRN